MNILERYPHVNNKLYHFEAIEAQGSANRDMWLVSIYKYSSHQDKHVFQDHLNPHQYISMMDEPDMMLDGIFEDDTERDVERLMHKNNIQVVGGGGTRDLLFLEEDARKCVALMQKKFQYSKI